MGRKKRNSSALTKAETRLSGLKAINPALDFGNNRNIAELDHLISQVRAKLSVYNNALAVLDSSRNELDELEKKLNSLSEQMLLGVAFEYGRDSHEYELAGGVRTSDRIRKSVKTRMKGSTDGQAA